MRQRQNGCALDQSSVVEAICLFGVRELRLGGSELDSSAQVQRLGFGLRHGKAGLEGQARRLGNNHTPSVVNRKSVNQTAQKCY